MKETKVQIKDYYGKELKIGDDVTIEQAWEDVAGHYHDECCTISRILPDGQLKFRIGHWKTRTAHEEKVQAFLNRCEFYGENVIKD